MTILDMTSRLDARTSLPNQRTAGDTVLRLEPATVTELPDATTRRLRETGIDSAVDALCTLLTQADTFRRSPGQAGVVLAGFAGQVRAYATSLGVLVYPDSPEDAFAVKRAILASLEAGPIDADAVRALALSQDDSPEAC